MSELPCRPTRCHRSSHRSSQQASPGVALLTALILVAIATAIAGALSLQTGLSLGRAQASSQAESAMQWVVAIESLAGDFIEERVLDQRPMHAAQGWGAPMGPRQIDESTLLDVLIEDPSGRFNLNALVDADGQTDPTAVAVFTRLLRLLELRIDWAEELADWIDADSRKADGGSEDSLYLTAALPYRAANQRLVSTSELYFLQGFTAEHYARLAPHVVALPRDAGLNVCSASAEILDALTGEVQWTSAREALARNRQDDCFPRLDALRNSFGSAESVLALERSLGLAEETRYFRLHSRIEIGSSRYSLYSLLRADPDPGGARRLQLVQRSPLP